MFRFLNKETSLEALKATELQKIQTFLNTYQSDSSEPVKQMKEYHAQLKEAGHYDQVFDLIPEPLKQEFRKNNSVLNRMMTMMSLLASTPAEKAINLLHDVSKSLYTSMLPHLSEARKEKEHVLMLDANEDGYFKKCSDFFYLQSDWTKLYTPERAAYNAGGDLSNMGTANTFGEIITAVEAVISQFSSLISQNASSHHLASSTSSTKQTNFYATSSSSNTKSAALENQDKLIAARNKAQDIRKKVFAYMKEHGYGMSESKFENEKTSEKTSFRRPGQ